MILLNHLRPLSPSLLIRQFLLIAGQRTFLDDALIGGEIGFSKKALDIADAAFQVVHGGVLLFFTLLGLRGLGFWL